MFAILIQVVLAAVAPIIVQQIEPEPVSAADELQQTIEKNALKQAVIRCPGTGQSTLQIRTFSPHPQILLKWLIFRVD